jgi:hypothetical protein
MARIFLGQRHIRSWLFIYSKKILEECDTTVDSILALKVDSLMKVIDLAIAQKEQGQQE